MADEWIDDLSDREYHAGPGLSSSMVKELLKSPAHYRQALLSPQADTTAMRFGRLVHVLTLEPDHLFDKFVVVDVASRNTKKYKDTATMHIDRDVILRGELEDARNVAKAVRDSPQVRDCVLTDGTRIGDLLEWSAECSLFWDEDGQLCKARPDLVSRDLGVIADLKTTRKAAPRQFASSAFQLDYDVSAAWYARGFERVAGRPLQCWLWVAVEKEAPYAVQVYQATPDVLGYGALRCEKALQTLAHCQQTDSWPVYASETLPLTLPAWVGF